VIEELILCFGMGFYIFVKALAFFFIHCKDHLSLSIDSFSVDFLELGGCKHD